MARLAPIAPLLAVAVVLALCGMTLSLPTQESPRRTRTVSYAGERVVSCRNVTVGALDSMDVWARRPDGSVEVRVSEEQRRLLGGEAHCTTIIDDVEQLVREEERASAAAGDNGWHEKYHSLDEIFAWYKELASKHADMLHLVDSIGETVEGRSQIALHLNAPNTFVSRRADAVPVVYIQCGIHAREWISPATCMYFVEYLLNNYQKDSRVKKLLDSSEIALVPVVNPDGYVFTWTGDRLWRKNRRKNDFLCHGVDLNRNYDDHWNQGGSSSNPCSETYHGKSAASEPEVLNTVAFFKSLAPVYAGLDMHSFSELILRPQGWTTKAGPDEKALKALGDRMRDAIAQVHGVRYTSQTSADLYITTGAASDWFYGREAYQSNKGGPRPNGFTIELRDNGRYGFELPADQIIPQGEEIIPAMLMFAQWSVDNPLKWQD